MNSRVSSRGKSKKAISSITISSLLFATAIVLKVLANLIPFLNFPNGGTVSFVLVPLVLIGLFCGPIWGLVLCTAFGGIDIFLGGGMGYHWLSLLLDYFVAYGLVGLTGFFSKLFYQKRSWVPIVAVTIGGLLQFLGSFFSGIIVWTSAFDATGVITPDFSLEAITFSITYNGGYMLPSVALCVVVMAMILKPLYALFDLPVVKALAPEEKVKHFELPSFYSLFPIYVFVNIAFFLVALDKRISMPFMAFLSLFFSALIIVIASILYARKKEEMDTRRQLITLLTILISSVLVLVSIPLIVNSF